MKTRVLMIAQPVIVMLALCSFVQAAWIPFTGDRAIRETEVKVESQLDNSVTLDVDIFGAEASDYDAATMTDTGRERFTVLKIDEYAFLSEIGNPKLPMVTAVLDVPHGAEIQVQILSSDYNEYSLAELGIDQRIAPALASVPKTEGATANFVLNEATYAKDAFYPERLTGLFEGGGLARGHRLATVQFYPVQYNPVKGKIRVYTRIKVKIDFVGANIPATVSGIVRDYSTVWEHYIRTMVVNYPEYLMAVPPLPIYYDIFYNGQALTLANKLRNWKMKKGYNIRMWNAAGWTATQISDTIRLQSPKATFLTIIGDPNSGSIALPASATGSSSADQTDLYYAETNESGYLPDMFNGRICVLDTTEGNISINKALRYERAIFGSAGTAWLKRACLIAGYDAGYQPVGIATNAYCRALMLPYGYQVDTLVIASSEQEARIVARINAGTAWCVYTAHGSQTYWAISSSGDFTIPELNGTTNLDMYSMPAGHCCLAGDYQYGSNCFGEVWDRIAGKGGLSYYGSVPSTYWDEDDWLQRRYFDAVYTDSIPGRMYERGRYTQWGLYWIENHTGSSMKRYYFEAYHVFNDPSLDTWTDIPDTLQVTHDPFVPPSPTSFAVNVKDNDGVTNLQDALVCVWIYTQTPQVHAAAYTNASGNVSLSISPTNPGDTMWVTVTKHDYKPYESFVLVQDAGMPATPTVTKPLDFGRLPDLNPALTFTSTDPDGDQIRYRVMWDTDPAFASPESSTTANYASGAIVNFNFPFNLANGSTYWWKVKCTDPSGSGYWTSYTTSRSFTVDTSLPANTCSWYQTTAAQFGFNTFNSTVIQGDSVVLVAAGSVVVETLQVQPFASASMPSGWTVVNGNGDAYQWVVGTTSDMGSYTPPDYGSYYAYYSDDDAGSGNISNNEELLSPKWYVGGLTGSVVMEYGWGFQV
ncbi:MAG TPA: C25 family cysteine peptidase, partial [bacterium]